MHRQSGERLPSDLTDAQWAHLEPLIPPADRSGRTAEAPQKDANFGQGAKSDRQLHGIINAHASPTVRAADPVIPGA